jgi:2',3'-cyclic-nucleotide 2'-phosphodiesterase (5'-nucleotidase family)
MTIRLLHYADLEGAYDDPAQMGRFVGMNRALRDSETLVVGAGDNIAPSGLSLVTDGKQAPELFGMIDADIDTLGNHDFDYGPETALSVVRDSPQQWVCANAFTDRGRFGEEIGIVPWTTMTISDLQIGFFGVAHPLTDEKSPGASALSFTDPIEAARTAVESLRSEGVDHIVCVSHLGNEEHHGQGEDDELVRSAGIDVVLGGHTHNQPRIERIEDALYVRGSGEAVDLLEVRFDGGWTAERHLIADAPRVDRVETAFRELQEQAGLTEVVAAVEEPIECTHQTCYHGESRLGNFVTDAYRWKTDADVGLQHSPGLRSSQPLADEVTVSDLLTIVPFDMEVVRCDVSGTTLRELLEKGGDLIYPEYPKYWHLHLSGGSLAFDFGKRELVDATVAGDALDPTASYSVALPENVLQWVDGLSADRDTLPAYGRQYEVLAEFARTRGIDPECAGRIDRIDVEQASTSR